VFPISKLLGLLVLTTRALPLATRHRALTYSIIHWTGRWGMLDVLLVAVLVAALKLGNSIEVSAGPAAVAFASCVILSLLAAASFDPYSLWENEA
jgi:paraquat-inducible protein A